MGKKDPRVDAYIASKAPFARPILTHLRGVVHATRPEVEETIKWGMPHFVYHGVLCHMAAFKAHCAFGFWKGRSVVETSDDKSGDAMGQLGRITDLADLPSPRKLASYVKRAAKLNDEKNASPMPAKPSKPAKKASARKLTVPRYFALAVKKNKQAWATFQGFSYSHRKEYVEWVQDAKTEATRNRRLGQAVEWLAEGKSRHWKYQNC